MALPNEELRRKHIRTLEVCQKLVEENSRLRHQSGRKSGNEGFTLSAEDNDLRVELDALKAKASELAESAANLEVRCKEVETRNATLESELQTKAARYDTQAVKSKSELERTKNMLREATRELAESKSRIVSAESDAMNHRERNTALEARIGNDTLTMDALRDEIEHLMRLNEEKQKATTPDESGLPRGKTKIKKGNSSDDRTALLKITKEMELVKGELADLKVAHSQNGNEPIDRKEEAGASTHSLESKHRELKVCLAAKENERERLHAENGVLEQECRRLSKLCIQNATTPPPAAATEKSQTPESKKLFADFVSLRKENQMLRRQIEDLKKSASRSIGMAKRAPIGGALGGRLLSQP